MIPGFKTRMAAWDADNMSTCSCRLRREDYERFRALCYSSGRTIHEVVRLLVGKTLLNSGVTVSDGLRMDIERDEKDS